jgi:UDP-N-acetylglucosamine 4,6-dehydratase/UDP-glucose 4-epimerase
MFDNKKVLITGGTGSLGKALTKKLLETGVSIIRIYSRDEWKQSQMRSELTDDRLRFFIGDVRDKERLSRAMEDIDIVIHAAALKQVPSAEYNPFEAVKTNIYGTQNVLESCLDNGVKTAIGIGTDKAVSPLNTYGATKLLMERLFISANFWKGDKDIKFICVRYGNVLGSRGSIVPIFVDQIKSGGKITVTDPNMTRFSITMDQALNLIFRAIKNGVGGEVFIPKLKAYTVGLVKDALLELLNSTSTVEKIPVRPGEKTHEVLINEFELRDTLETDEDYVITNQHPLESDQDSHNLKITSLSNSYTSDTVELFTKEELKEILISEKLV